MQEIQRMTTRQRHDQQTGKYRELITIAEEVVDDAGTVLEKTSKMRAEDVLAAIASDKIREEIKHYCDLGSHVIDQARRRVLNGEQVPNAEKVYSIFAPHTDLIKRGKVRTTIEFGHKVFLAESSQGLITQYEVLKGNPSDETHVALPSNATPKPLVVRQNCTAQTAASTVSKIWHRASTTASRSCAFHSAAAQEHRNAKHT